MDWFVYDSDLRHEIVKLAQNRADIQKKPAKDNVIMTLLFMFLILIFCRRFLAKLTSCLFSLH